MILDIIVNVIVIVTGFRICKNFGFDVQNLKNVRLLWAYHLLFSIFFYYYILSEGGSDSTRYWEDAKLIENFDGFLELMYNKGTQATIAINYFPSGILGLSYFTGSLMYALLGFIGLLFYYKLTIDKIPFNSKWMGIPLFPALFFLPNLHFWTCNVGKDTLSFFVIATIFYFFNDFKKRWFIMLCTVVLGYLVRPHIILFIGISFFLGYIIRSNTKAYLKFGILLMFLAVTIILLPVVAEYAKIQEFSVEGYEQYSSSGVANLSEVHTKSSVDVNSYPFPLKVFTFLYRPTFTDIFSVPALIAAIENLFLLLLSFMVIRRSPIKTFKAAPFIFQVAMFLLIIGTVLFSVSLGNLGIMLRMRNMFLPGLLIFILWSFSYYQERKLNT
jgi:hypothetical protein